MKIWKKKTSILTRSSLKIKTISSSFYIEADKCKDRMKTQ